MTPELTAQIAEIKKRNDRRIADQERSREACPYNDCPCKRELPNTPRADVSTLLAALEESQKEIERLKGLSDG